MADIISTSISGLRAFQTALSTTAHNISNVGTEGYSRQVVELTAREPLGVGNFQIGQGVDLKNIKRIVDYLSSLISEISHPKFHVWIFLMISGHE